MSQLRVAAARAPFDVRSTAMSNFSASRLHAPGYIYRFELPQLKTD